MKFSYLAAVAILICCYGYIYCTPPLNGGYLYLVKSENTMANDERGYTVYKIVGSQEELEESAVVAKCGDIYSEEFRVNIKHAIDNFTKPILL